MSSGPPRPPGAPEDAPRPAAQPAVFRPVARGVGQLLVLGGVGGFVAGSAAGIPPLLAALFGALAAALAGAFRHATGLRAVATEAGLAVKGREVPLEVRWSDLRLGFGRSPRPGGGLQPYAIVADARGRSFAFADLSGGPAPDPVPGADGEDVAVVDLREAPLLLALVVQRTPAWHVFPEALRAPPAAEAAPASGAPEPAPAAPAAPARRSRVALLGLAAKLGGTVAKALKTANLGSIAVSGAVFGVLFSWKVAIAILLQLFVHEYGHVHAMRRTGMKVRGMYFIPLLGAVAVTEDAFTSRRQQAYVALSGPLWGTALALLPLGLWLWTREPFYAQVAAWWGLVNLFNLIPVSPLDGGRVLQALAVSFSSTLGIVLTVLGLAAMVAAGLALGYGLVWLVAVLGAMELLGEARARAGGRALRLLPERERLGPAHFRWLRAIAGPPLGSPSERFWLRDLERTEQAARATPMTPRQVAAWGLAYAALAAALLALVHFASRAAGPGGVAQLLA